MKTKQLKQAKRLFDKAAKLWCEGNNSGNGAILAQKEKESAKAQEKAELLVKEIFPAIEIDYPGLYPSFKLNGYNFYSLESLEIHNL